MGKLAMDRTETTIVEAILKDDLARGDRALLSVAPVVSHLLDNSGPALVTDAIIACLRGMLEDIAVQILQAVDPQNAQKNASALQVDTLVEGLSDNNGLLDHLYALALEGTLTARLDRQLGIDPVLSPLLQELIASDHAAIAELAMKALAAQSRFVQGQRRMGLGLGELPAELFLSPLNSAQNNPAVTAIEGSDVAFETLRKRYDEGAGRLALFARLVLSMRGGAVAALDLEHAGLALFTSALAGLTRQSRDVAMFSCHERQTARLALSLRAAGLDQAAIKNQFVMFGPVERLHAAIAEIAPERAQEMLSASHPAAIPGKVAM